MTKYDFTAIDKVELSPVVKKIWLFSTIIVLILFSMLFLPWQQTVKGKGEVIALDPTQRDYAVLSPVDGFVEEFYVHENQFVKKGEPLFKMVDLDKEYLAKLEKIQEDLKTQHQNTSQEILTTKKQKQQTQEYLDHGVEVYLHKIAQAKERLESLGLHQIALEKNYEITKNNFERMESLYKKGIESQRNYELSHNLYTKAQADLKKNKLDQEIEKKNITIAQKEQKKFLSETNTKVDSFTNALLSADNRLKSLTQQLANHSVTMERYKNSQVVAPKDGYVVRIFKNDQNRYIKKGEDVLHFSPSVTKKAIRLKVTDFNMPLIKEGLPTRIMFYGWPALQISGWPKIQFGSFGGVVSKVEHISHEKGYYYAYVVESKEEPWPKGDDLRIGTQASVYVRLSTVPIWYQLWRLMNALPPQMVTPDTEKY